MAVLAAHGARARRRRAYAAPFAGGRLPDNEDRRSKASSRRCSSAARTRGCTSRPRTRRASCARWAIEWGGAAQLRNAGVDGKTLKVGDKVESHGTARAQSGRQPAADGLHRAALGRLELGQQAGRGRGLMMLRSHSMRDSSRVPLVTRPVVASVCVRASRRIGRNRRRALRRRPPQQSARQAAPIDFTGTWASVVTEDWQWRFVTPIVGDYTGVPLNSVGDKIGTRVEPGRRREGRRAVQGLRRGRDQSPADAPAGLVGGRQHLKLDWDLGTQSRLVHFDKSQTPAGARRIRATPSASGSTCPPAGGRGGGGGGGGRGAPAPAAAPAARLPPRSARRWRRCRRRPAGGGGRGAAWRRRPAPQAG